MEQARKGLEDVKQAGEGAWQELRPGLERSWQELQNSIQRARARAKAERKES